MFGYNPYSHWTTRIGTYPNSINPTRNPRRIAQHVQSSISLRKESQQLLEHAKLTVEGAIQNGGKIASEYYVLQEKSAMELHIAIYVLLHEVGIISNDAKVKVSNVVCSCKKLSDSFLASGRLDAEYYQPKYDLLLRS